MSVCTVKQRYVNNYDWQGLFYCTISLVFVKSNISLQSIKHTIKYVRSDTLSMYTECNSDFFKALKENQTENASQTLFTGMK